MMSSTISGLCRSFVNNPFRHFNLAWAKLATQTPVADKKTSSNNNSIDKQPPIPSNNSGRPKKKEKNNRGCENDYNNNKYKSSPKTPLDIVFHDKVKSADIHSSSTLFSTNLRHFSTSCQKNKRMTTKKTSEGDRTRPTTNNTTTSSSSITSKPKQKPSSVSSTSSNSGKNPKTFNNNQEQQILMKNDDNKDDNLLEGHHHHRQSQSTNTTTSSSFGRGPIQTLRHGKLFFALANYRSQLWKDRILNKLVEFNDRCKAMKTIKVKVNAVKQGKSIPSPLSNTG